MRNSSPNLALPADPKIQDRPGRCARRADGASRDDQSSSAAPSAHALPLHAVDVGMAGRQGRVSSSGWRSSAASPDRRTVLNPRSREALLPAGATTLVRLGPRAHYARRGQRGQEVPDARGLLQVREDRQSTRNDRHPTQMNISSSCVALSGDDLRGRLTKVETAAEIPAAMPLASRTGRITARFMASPTCPTCSTVFSTE